MKTLFSFFAWAGLAAVILSGCGGKGNSSGSQASGGISASGGSAAGGQNTGVTARNGGGTAAGAGGDSSAGGGSIAGGTPTSGGGGASSQGGAATASVGSSSSAGGGSTAGGAPSSGGAGATGQGGAANGGSGAGGTGGSSDAGSGTLRQVDGGGDADGPSSCVPGQTICTGLQESRCGSDGQWVSKSCDWGCLANSGCAPSVEACTTHCQVESCSTNCDFTGFCTQSCVCSGAQTTTCQPRSCTTDEDCGTLGTCDTAASVCRARPVDAGVGSDFTGISWTVLSPAPSPVSRANFAGCALDDKLYVFGGEALNGDPTTLSLEEPLEVLDPLANTILQKSGLSMITTRGRLSPGAAALNGKLYSIGGQTYTGYGYMLSSLWSICNIMEEYDTANDRWTARATMPTARHRVAAAVAGGKVYVFGGLGPSGELLNASEVFDPALNAWQSAAPMPTPRYASGATEIGGKIYVLGGFATEKGDAGAAVRVPVQVVEEYDPSTDTWGAGAPMLVARGGFSAVTLNGRIYAIGGYNETSLLLAVEEYSPETNSWTGKTPLPTAGTTSSTLVSGSAGGKLYVYGAGAVLEGIVLGGAGGAGGTGGTGGVAGAGGAKGAGGSATGGTAAGGTGGAIGGAGGSSGAGGLGAAGTGGTRASGGAPSAGGTNSTGGMASTGTPDAAPSVSCGDTEKTAGHSCRAIYQGCGGQDGTYWINPSGATDGAFQVYCRGGWALVAKLGENASPTSDFASDLKTEILVDGNPPAADEYAHWDLGRFAGFGSIWTVRSDTDASNDQTHYQYAFFAPKVGVACLPSLAGTNWKNTTTQSLLEHLTRSTTTGLQNHTWLGVPDCIGGHCDSPVLLWTYRLDSESGDCLDSDGQTRICHAVQGGIATIGGPCGNGSMTAAFGMLDGVGHCWAKKASYWLRDERSDTP